MLGIEVLHQHERHAGIERQMFEKMGEGFQAASGCSDSDDWKGRGVPPGPELRLRFTSRLNRPRLRNGAFFYGRFR